METKISDAIEKCMDYEDKHSVRMDWGDDNDCKNALADKCEELFMDIGFRTGVSPEKFALSFICQVIRNIRNF